MNLHEYQAKELLKRYNVPHNFDLLVVVSDGLVTFLQFYDLLKQKLIMKGYFRKIE